MAAVAKPDLMENYAVAVQASGLTLEENTERALDRLGAMGAAALALELGDQDARLTIGAAQLKPRPTEMHHLAAALCPMLWRIQGAPQPSDAVIATAAQLFARWMSLQGRMADDAPGLAYSDRLLPFAIRLLREWRFNRCGRCGGSGQLQLTAAGPVRTLGTNARNGRFVQCKVCHGQGSALMDRVEQAGALGLNVKVFDDAGWTRRFRVGRVWISRLLRRPNAHLRRELERG